MGKRLSTLKRLEEHGALRMVELLGTSGCTLVFLALALVPLVWHQAEATVQYVSSAFLQLVFLPILLQGTNIQAKRAEKLAARRHGELLRHLELLGAYEPDGK